MEDYLKHKIQRRPDRQSLIEQHILEDTSVSPSLQDAQRQLKRAKLADDLNDRLSHRPGPLELVKGNILLADERLAQAIKEGALQFKATSEGEAVKHPPPVFYFSSSPTSSPESSSDGISSTSNFLLNSPPQSTGLPTSSQQFQAPPPPYHQHHNVLPAGGDNNNFLLADFNAALSSNNNLSGQLNAGGSVATFTPIEALICSSGVAAQFPSGIVTNNSSSGLASNPGIPSLFQLQLVYSPALKSSSSTSGNNNTIQFPAGFNFSSSQGATFCLTPAFGPINGNSSSIQTSSPSPQLAKEVLSQSISSQGSLGNFGLPSNNGVLTSSQNWSFPSLSTALPINVGQSLDQQSTQIVTQDKQNNSVDNSLNNLTFTSESSSPTFCFTAPSQVSSTSSSINEQRRSPQQSNQRRSSISRQNQTQAVSSGPAIISGPLLTISSPTSNQTCQSPSNNQSQATVVVSNSHPQNPLLPGPSTFILAPPDQTAVTSFKPVSFNSATSGSTSSSNNIHGNNGNMTSSTSSSSPSSPPAVGSVASPSSVMSTSGRSDSSSSTSTKNRKKSKSKVQPKSRTIKFHEYKVSVL